MATSNKLISVQHLVKEYNNGTVKALNDCNLDIRQGTPFLGPISIHDGDYIDAKDSDIVLSYHKHDPEY